MRYAFCLLLYIQISRKSWNCLWPHQVTKHPGSCKFFQIEFHFFSWSDLVRQPLKYGVTNKTVISWDQKCSYIWVAQDLDYQGCFAYKKSCISVFEGTQYLIFGPKNRKYKTQCQICKRLARPIIPHSWSGPEKGITHGCDHYGTVNSHFFCVFGHFWQSFNQPNEQLTKQPGDPNASQLLTSEKAVFYKITTPIDDKPPFYEVHFFVTSPCFALSEYQ